MRMNNKVTVNGVNSNRIREPFCAYADCSIRYGDLKKQLAEDILAVTIPIRERVNDILADETYLSRVVREGAERARERAAKTLAEMREIMGIRKF